MGTASLIMMVMMMVVVSTLFSMLLYSPSIPAYTILLLTLPQLLHPCLPGGDWGTERLEVHSVWSIGQPALDTSWVEQLSVGTTTQYILMKCYCIHYVYRYLFTQLTLDHEIKSYIMRKPPLGALIILILFTVAFCCRLPLKHFV